ncbi:MAG: PAS domain S-box protein [Bacteroidota bacterium]
MTYSRESKTSRILLIDSNKSAVEFIGQKLRANYTQLFALHYASEVVEAMERILTESFDCVLLGNAFSYAQKMDIRLALKQEQPNFDIPVIELDYQPDQLTARIFRAEAADFIIKSHPDSLQKIIKDTMRKKYGEEDLPQLRIQYWEVQRHLQSREKQIQRLQQALEKGKEVNRLNEQELKKTLRRLSFQFDNTPLAIIEWDKESKIRRWSKEAETLFGWKARDVMGKTFRDFAFVYAEDTEVANRMVENLREGLESKNIVYHRNYHKNGQEIHCEWCNSVLYNDHKEIDSFISIVQDVTQLRQKEQLLLESQERFHKLSQASFDGIAIHDQGIIVECNEKLAEIFDYSQEMLIGSSAFTYFTTESLAIILENVKRQNETPYEATGIRKDGSFFPVEMTGKPIMYGNRELRITTVRDITERKKAETSLRESEIRFRSTFEQAAVGLMHINLDGQLLRANQKICDMSGYTRDELLAMSIYELLDPLYLENNLKVFVQVLKGEIENYVSEKLCALKNGKTCWVNLNISRVVDDQTQRAIYFVAVIEDISERKESELLLQRANADLDTFVYNASHDLRGPIASLLGLCSVAQMEIVDPNALDYLSLINKTATHMNGVLLSLILMNRVKNHIPERSLIDFQGIFDETLLSLSDEKGFDNVQFSTDIQVSIPFYSDASLLSTILKNTLENAIRYQFTRRGPSVKMIVQETPDGEGLWIKIQDNGIGIPLDLTENVFEMFFRGTEQSTGSGLGLYVVQKIAEKLAGTAHVNSLATDYTEIAVFLPQMSL